MITSLRRSKSRKLMTATHRHLVYQAPLPVYSVKKSLFYYFTHTYRAIQKG